MLFSLLASLACFCIYGMQYLNIEDPFFLKSLHVCLFGISKLFVSCLFGIIQVFLAETFPTQIRTFAIGFIISLGMLSTLLTPLIVEKYQSNNAFELVFGSFGILSMILFIFT